MHEPFDPQCGLCRLFVYAFPSESPLGEWGYCQLQDNPSQDVLRSLEEAARGGNLKPLLSSPLMHDPDDGCQHFAPR